MLYLNGKEIAKSDVFSAGESGIATIISFDLSFLWSFTLPLEFLLKSFFSYGSFFLFQRFKWNYK